MHAGMRGPFEKRRKQARPWGLLLGTAFIVLLWVVVTLQLLPDQLHNVSAVLDGTFNQEYQESRENEGGAGARRAQKVVASPKPPPPSPPTITMEQIIAILTGFLNELHEKYARLEPDPDIEGLWEMYKEVADRRLLPLDRTYTGYGLFPVRDDDTIFVSVASYRDELCANTLEEMYGKASAPDKLFVGLVQQNCREDCQTGVLAGGVVEDAPADSDCYVDFCATDVGEPVCQQGQVRNFFVNESESLGPAVGRYFASKLWHGETYYMQIDSHSIFERGWDDAYILDIKNTPSFPRSVLSHYPPDTHEQYQNEPGHRICDCGFSTDPIEADIIRLGGGQPNEDRSIRAKPCPAPFTGAGFIFAHASFLRDVPFDPYVPWVFMGEEILFSLRLWTWGYDIYGPTRNMIAHYYVRNHKPKFWETVGRLFKTPGIHNDIHDVIIHRVKGIVGYPESTAEIMAPRSLLCHLDLYGDGPVRSAEEYMRTVGIDVVAKRLTPIAWCFKCEAPRPVY
ncbi:unnamed protein product [Phaeothamnion confervicola]